MLQWLKHLPYSGEAPRLRGEVNVEFTNKTVERSTIPIYDINLLDKQNMLTIFSPCCVMLKDVVQTIFRVLILLLLHLNEFILLFIKPQHRESHRKMFLKVDITLTTFRLLL